MNRVSIALLFIWITHVSGLIGIYFISGYLDEQVSFALFITTVYASFSLGVYTQMLGGKAKTWKELWKGQGHD